jgi:NYN domain
VDGLNLYYGIRRWHKSKWLDIGKLCLRLFPDDEIASIRYFTAHVKGNPAANDRQQAYLRALATTPNLVIHKGTFLVNETWMPLAMPSRWRVPVIKTEEKASDVNIATHLLLDAFEDRFEMAVIITNDSDLRVPIRVVQEAPFNKPVWVVNPHPRRANALRPTHHLDLHSAVVRDCQFPNPVNTRRGKAIAKPTKWVERDE